MKHSLKYALMSVATLPMLAHSSSAEAVVSQSSNGLLTNQVVVAGKPSTVNVINAAAVKPAVFTPPIAAKPIAKKIVVGPIHPKSGEIIDNISISSTTGDCIVIDANVKNVTIKNSTIGPCSKNGATALGILGNPGSTEITMTNNVFHDVSSGAYFNRSVHPIIFTRNSAYNILGPFPRGQMIQFDQVMGGTKGSKITCNVSDAQDNRKEAVTDHINMWRSVGVVNDPTEIAYNRIRGGHERSGSGILPTDGGSSYNWVHDNTIVNVANVGTGIVGGNHTVIENNRIYNDGKTSLSGLGFVIRDYYAKYAKCDSNTVRKNRVYSFDVAWLVPPAPNHFWDSKQCTNTTMTDNVFGDKTLTAAIFDEVPAACK